MKTPTETWLPIFPGFYQTIFDESESFVEMELQDESEFRSHHEELANVPFDFIEDNFWDAINYKDANLSVAQACVDGVESLLSDFVESIKYQTLRSPREYNFATDAIDVEIVPKTDAIRQYIKDNWKAFSRFVESRYTSRDGFISHYSPNPHVWKEETEYFTKWDADGHYLGSILQFIADNEEIDDMDLYDESNVYEAFYNGVSFDFSRITDSWEAQKDLIATN